MADHVMQLTDNQWYNFICGMQVGLKLRDLTLPEYTTNRVLTPIAVGGLGCIGFLIPDLLWDGETVDGTIPVCTHDVDIAYSAFLVKITWDPNRMRVTGLSNADFGTFGNDMNYELNNNTGTLIVRGLKQPSEYFDQDIILFNINIRLLTFDITESNPIVIKIVNNSRHSTDGTALYTYVDNDLFMITPIKNKNGKITPEVQEEESKLGDDQRIMANMATTGLYIGASYTKMNSIGAVGITAVSNERDNFPYNGVRLHFTIYNDLGLFTYLYFTPMPGWTIDVTMNTVGPRIYVELIATRTTASIGEDLIAAMIYEIGELEESDSYHIWLENTFSLLFNNTVEPEQKFGDDELIHKGNGSILWQVPIITDPSGQKPVGDMYGSIDGSGQVFSSCDQLIFIQADSMPPVPYYLQSGWNDMVFSIPFLSGSDVAEEAPIKIEAKGYILIPAGFEFNTKITDNAPELFGTPNMVEKLEFRDFYDYDIEAIPVPVDLDNLIDEVVFEDIHSIDIIEIENIFEEDIVDEMMLEDTDYIDIEEPPYTGGTDEIIDNINFVDINIEDIVNITVSNNNINDTLQVDDFVVIDFE